MSGEQEPESPIVVMTHLYPDITRAFARRVGMSLSRIEVLHEVWHAGEISQVELARRLDMEGALLTRFVKQMEAVGLVTRRTDPADNRFTLVRLAPAGQAALEKMEALGDAFQSQLLEGLSPAERASLVRAMKRMQGNLVSMEKEP
jgi:DNA-binding MarR family transcriptional regulator